MIDTYPSVSVVIPNWNGAHHLSACLDSVFELDYPGELEVIVVDNGSTDESRRLLSERYPQVVVQANRENLGFADGCNVGARLARSECVAFLNNDMRVDHGWLGALVDGYEPDAKYVCVAGVILNWEGDRVDFVRGWVNFHGHAGQDHFGESSSEVLVDDGSDLLFACGGSMLIQRDVFLKLGGFDPAYFAFFEDVDLGWRLWLAGYKVRLAGSARSFHRHHGTAGTVSDYRRALLYDRNALFTLIKNIGADNLAPVLASALFLLIKRAQIFTGSPRKAFDLGSSDAGLDEKVMRSGLASLHAVSDVLEELPVLLDRRDAVQRLRRRPDAEIFALFHRPFFPLSQEAGYLEASLQVRDLFGLARLFRWSRATSALVVTDGESERLRAISRILSPLLDVTSISPADGDDVLRELVAESDVVVVAGDTRHARTLTENTGGLLLVDIGDASAALDPELGRRADVLLTSSGGPTSANVAGQTRVVDVATDSMSSDALREIVREPWRWRRRTAGEDPGAPPEDLQQLLRRWREHYRDGARVRHRLRSLPIPLSVETFLRRVLGRPNVTG